MTKLLDFIYDLFDVAIDIWLRLRGRWWDLVARYESGLLQEWVKARLAYLSWILIGIAMFLISSMAHYIGFETLDDLLAILVVLIAIRFSARWGY